MTQGYTWVGGIPSNADLDGWTGLTASQQQGREGETEASGPITTALPGGQAAWIPSRCLSGKGRWSLAFQVS